LQLVGTEELRCFKTMDVEARKRVAYFISPYVGDHHYGPGHPMKPQRVAVTNSLVYQYGLTKYMDTYMAMPASDENLKEFHAPAYVDFLKKLNIHNFHHQNQEIVRNYLDTDCPFFHGLYDYCASYAGASLAAASHLNHGKADIAINWSGGLHHAKMSKASGFCYINDIVLAILELLKYYPRVLYVDIDVHHGDGVQEAFIQSDRVLTFSSHQFSEGFFPGTGLPDEIGIGPGKYFAVNVPLKEGATLATFEQLVKPLLRLAVESFLPSVIVLQCGADSLACDRLGHFSLGIEDHGVCVSFVRDFNLPMLVVGGGGYTLKNVARCWAYETSLLVRKDVPNHIPLTCEYREMFKPKYLLRPELKKHYENQNHASYLNLIREVVSCHLRRVAISPSVALRPLGQSENATNVFRLPEDYNFNVNEQ
ncbi:Histone deacetylase 3, partial [Trichinella pseudospiralis]